MPMVKGVMCDRCGQKRLWIWSKGKRSDMEKSLQGRWMEAWEEIPLPCLHKRKRRRGKKTEVPPNECTLNL